MPAVMSVKFTSVLSWCVNELVSRSYKHLEDVGVFTIKITYYYSDLIIVEGRFICV